MAILFPSFLRQIKNSCSGFSRSISVFRGNQAFVLEVRRVPGLKICVSLCAGATENRGRYPRN